jgi:hypothetical protein
MPLTHNTRGASIACRSEPPEHVIGGHGVARPPAADTDKPYPRPRAEGPAVRQALGIAQGRERPTKPFVGPTGQMFIGRFTERLARWADTANVLPEYPGRCPGLGDQGPFGAAHAPAREYLRIRSSSSVRVTSSLVPANAFPDKSRPAGGIYWAAQPPQSEQSPQSIQLTQPT